MPRKISTIFRVLPLLLPIGIFAQASSNTDGNTQAAEPSQVSMSAEDEAFLDWLEADPLEDLGLDSGSLTIWSTSLALGPGYSNNFLKRRTPVSSRFLKLETDFFINAYLKHSSIMALLYIEGTQYDAASEVDNEGIILLHANWTRSALPWEFGSELDVFAGDQIFDASLSDNAEPVGERLRQFRPELTLFMARNIGSKDQIRLALNIERVLYERSEDDYLSPGIEVEWNRSWLKGLESKTKLRYFEERYDEDVSIDRRGFTVPSRARLHIRGYVAEEEISWKPASLKNLKLTLRMGASYEDDRYGENDDALRLWSAMSTDLDLPWMDLRFTGRWQSTRYQDRQVGFFDERLQRRNYRSLRVEAERELPWNLALGLVLEWDDFDSRISSESFSERRIETVLRWSY